MTWRRKTNDRQGAWRTRQGPTTSITTCDGELWRGDAVWTRTVTEDDLRKRIAAVAGGAADELLAYYERRDPVRGA